MPTLIVPPPFMITPATSALRTGCRRSTSHVGARDLAAADLESGSSARGPPGHLGGSRRPRRGDHVRLSVAGTVELPMPTVAPTLPGVRGGRFPAPPRRRGNSRGRAALSLARHCSWPRSQPGLARCSVADGSTAGWRLLEPVDHHLPRRAERRDPSSGRFQHPKCQPPGALRVAVAAVGRCHRSRRRLPVPVRRPGRASRQTTRRGAVRRGGSWPSRARRIDAELQDAARQRHPAGAERRLAVQVPSRVLARRLSPAQLVVTR